MKSITCPAQEQSISTVLNFIETQLKQQGFSRSETVHGMLMAEECIVSMIRHSAADGEMTVRIYKRLGKVFLSVQAKGSRLDIDSLFGSVSAGDFGETDEETEFAIRSLLLRNFKSRIGYSFKAGTNRLDILMKTDTSLQTKTTFAALFAALVIGAGLRFLLPDAGQVLNQYLLSPVTGIFMRCMECLVGPIVFLSILNSILGFDDMKVLGRIGIRVMAGYTMTSVIAILLGFACFTLFSPGVFSSMVLPTGAAAETAASTGVVDTIVSFFSDNAVGSFFNNDTIQIIVIAIFCGAALNGMGEGSAPLRSGIGALNEMVTRIGAVISGTIPLVVFCSITSMFQTLELSSMLSLLQMALTIFTAYILMLGVYCVLIRLIGRVNPLVMLKKYGSTALTVFSLSSSNASIPMNISFSRKLGISPKLCSFSIPLGATINMDGDCIADIVMVLFIAKVYGASFTPVGLAQLFVITLIVSMGTPGISISTAGLIIPMLAICGLPAEAGLLIVGIDTVIDMFRTVLNTTGDQTVTLMTAARENMLDKEQYYSESK